MMNWDIILTKFVDGVSRKNSFDVNVFLFNALRFIEGENVSLPYDVHRKRMSHAVMNLKRKLQW